MLSFLKIYISSVVFVFCCFFINKGTAQNVINVEQKSDKRIFFTWCTVTIEEQRKCKSFSYANERDRIRVGSDYFRVDCLQATDRDECMALLEQEKATIISVDAGEVFVGGRYHSLVPIAQEAFYGGQKYYYAVAVVKRGTLPDVHSLHDLRGKQACFAGVQTFAGWVLPIYTLMREGGMEIVDCNNQVKSATTYFGPSCAVDCLTSKYNPIGDNSDKLCQLCTGKIPGGRCTNSDPYAGYEGAFKCLVEKGDIAFIKHNTVTDVLAGNTFLSLNKDSFELLCKDGSRRPIDDYFSCNWGRVPTNAILTTSASQPDTRRKYQIFLKKATELYGQRKRQSSTISTSSGRPNYNYNDNFGNSQSYDPYSTSTNRRNRYKRQLYRNYDRTSTTDRNQYVQITNRFNPYNEQTNRRPSDPFDFNRKNTTSKPREPYESLDPFSFDPYRINSEQYGVNIDPYQTYEEKNRKFMQYSTTTTTTTEDPFLSYVYNETTNGTSLYETFSLFESTPKYGNRSSLLLSETAEAIVPLNENQQTFTGYLGDSLDVILGVRDCQIHRMTLCVTSEEENRKCVKMKEALKAQLLKPELECHKAHSQINCMQAIKSGVADVISLDASDVYTAGLNFDLVPFISEVYNLNEPEYYVVAVVKESDPSTELTYLRGKNTCHGAVNTAAGWVYPLAFLISNGWIRSYGCNSIRAAAEYFTKSCIPGAISTEYNIGVPYDNMCDLCHGVSWRYCRRDASEDYYGHTGAFRCLVEGGGHVAFVKHTTVTENTGGKRKEIWARDNFKEDYELLCPDGTRDEVDQYEKCNLGKVASNAIVTRGGYGYNETHVNAYINLFLYAQTFFGRKTTDEFSFSMFASEPPYTDLIFQDATTQLKVIEPSRRNYVTYLGGNFMRARRVVDCEATASSVQISIGVLIIGLTTILVNTA